MALDARDPGVTPTRNLVLVSIPIHEALVTEVVHATPRSRGNPLCGVTTYEGEAVLQLDHPLARLYRRSVNCQGCLEWMHA